MPEARQCDTCRARTPHNRCNGREPCEWCRRRKIACTYTAALPIAPIPVQPGIPDPIGDAPRANEPEQPALPPPPPPADPAFPFAALFADLPPAPPHQPLADPREPAQPIPAPPLIAQPPLPPPHIQPAPHAPPLADPQPRRTSAQQKRRRGRRSDPGTPVPNDRSTHDDSDQSDDGERNAKRKRAGQRRSKRRKESSSEAENSSPETSTASHEGSTLGSDDDSSTDSREREYAKAKKLKEKADRAFARAERQRSKGKVRKDSTALKHRHRPDKAEGQLAAAEDEMIPRKITKLMEEGWKEHFSLACLTNAYCQSRDAATDPDVNSWTIKSGRFVAATAPLTANKKETELDLAEWTQAWRRLFVLIG
ncbi:hypothetical protein FRC06_002844 [Ceratobasidium sp. 370]|nr:hypothetical protein FRC06_002844 [Ceratobasidium sp. 370]